MSTNGLRLVHLHSQRRRGNPVNIVGTRDGLTALRDSLNKVLDGDGSADDSLMIAVSDGVRYRLFVKLREERDYWKKAAVPYTMLPDREARPDAVFPWREADPDQRVMEDSEVDVAYVARFPHQEHNGYVPMTSHESGRRSGGR